MVIPVQSYHFVRAATREREEFWREVGESILEGEYSIRIDLQLIKSTCVSCERSYGEGDGGQQGNSSRGGEKLRRKGGREKKGHEQERGEKERRGEKKGKRREGRRGRRGENEG